MQSTAALLVLATTLAVGCGTQVITPSQSSSATAGGGGDASTSASGTGGAGGGFVVSSSTGAPPPPSCNDATVFVDIVGDGANQHYDASCSPEGHLLLPGGAKTPGSGSGGGALTITTCPLSANQVLVLYGGSTTWPATINDATVYYYHDGAEYDASPGSGAELEVLTFEPVGGMIEGTFTAIVVPKDPSGNPAKIQITGKFRVCRGGDWIPV
jgi:hypothetical protein